MSDSTSTSLATLPDGVYGEDTKTISWVHLTTPWPSYAGCETSFWQVYEDSVVAWDPGYGIRSLPARSCLPPAQTSWWDANQIVPKIDIDSTTFSIGPIVCPEAFTTATTTLSAVGVAIWTKVACCPSEYHWTGFDAQCYSDVTQGQVIQWVNYTGSTESNTVISTMTTISQVWAIAMNGWLFSESSTSGSSATATATGDAPSATSSSSAGLSAGAKAGIGAGVAVVALAIIAAAVLLFLRRRKRKATLIPHNDGNIPPNAKLHDGSDVNHGNLRNGGISELPDVRNPIEIP